MITVTDVLIKHERANHKSRELCRDHEEDALISVEGDALEVGREEDGDAPIGSRLTYPYHPQQQSRTTVFGWNRIRWFIGNS